MDDEPTEASVKDEFPDWQFFDGTPVALRYARLRGSSPPVVVRGEDWQDLRDEIIRATERIEQRKYWQMELDQRAADQRRHDEEGPG